MTKKENNKRYYEKHKESEIKRVRAWEKEHPEKRKEYTKKYYQSEQGKLKKAEQRKRRLIRITDLREQVEFLMKRENKLQQIEQMFKSGVVDLEKLHSIVMECE